MLDRINVVLMETSHSGNIGAVARAMKNMGFSRLILVNPRSAPDEDAFARCSGAIDILNNAKIVDTLDEAIARSSLVIGASARNRKIVWPIMNPRDCAEKIARETQHEEISLLFGREDRGLSNDELQRCHYHVHIPADPTFSSLNLAMAVQVVCYEIRMKYLSMLEEGGISPQLKAINSAAEDGWDEPAATVEEVEGFLSHLENTLIETEFLDPDNPRQLMARLRRLYQRVGMDRVEVNIMRGFLKSVLDLKKSPKL